MRRIFILVEVIVILCFGMGAQAVEMVTVFVDDSGNEADTRYGNYGALNYEYKIGTYEVTTGQYTEFLNAKAKSDPYGLYNPSMAILGSTWFTGGCNIQRSESNGSYVYTVGNGSSSDITNWANRPVNYVTYWDSVRFANWLGNGQGNGSTETGAYTITSDGITNNTIIRNSIWKFAVTSEDEWYKAAYYMGSGTNAGYWDYATQSNTAPRKVKLDNYTDPGNTANWGFGNLPSTYLRTNVGEFEKSTSHYGTFDQSGNVWEWTEAIIGDTRRGLRGGAFDCNTNSQIGVAYRHPGDPPGGSYYSIGFRVSENPYADYFPQTDPQAVPEASSILGACIMLLPVGLRELKNRLRK